MKKYAKIGFNETSFSSITDNYIVSLKECDSEEWKEYGVINYTDFPIYVDIGAFLGETTCYSYNIVIDSLSNNCSEDYLIPSQTPTPTVTPTITNTPTITPTVTVTPTITPTVTVTPTLSSESQVLRTMYVKFNIL